LNGIICRVLALINIHMCLVQGYTGSIYT